MKLFNSRELMISVDVGRAVSEADAGSAVGLLEEEIPFGDDVASLANGSEEDQIAARRSALFLSPDKLEGGESPEVEACQHCTTCTTCTACTACSGCTGCTATNWR